MALVWINRVMNRVHSRSWTGRVLLIRKSRSFKPPGYPDPVNFDAFEGRIGFVRITIAQYMHPETLFPENLNLPAYPIITLKIVVNDDSYLFNHSTCCQIYME